MGIPPLPGTAPRATSSAARTVPSAAAASTAATTSAPLSDPYLDPFTAAAEASQTPEEMAVLRREAAFDANFRMRTELDRETNALRDMAFQQMKEDDEYTKKWIALI
jgi:hypothetical protein